MVIFHSFLYVYQRVNRFPRVVSRIVLVRASHRVCLKRKNLTISWWIMRFSPPMTLDLEGLLFYFESYFFLSSSLYYCIYIYIYTSYMYIHMHIYIYLHYINDTLHISHRFIEHTHISTFRTLAKTLRSPELRGLDLCEPELRRQRRFWSGCSMGKTQDFYGISMGKRWENYGKSQFEGGFSM